MTEVFQIQLPDGRTVGIQADSPEAAAKGARSILAREKGEAQGKAGGVLPYIDNLVRQAANGATFNYADELTAGLDAVTGRRGSYDEALAENRGQDAAFAKANPIAATTANLAGNIAGTLAAGRFLPIAPAMGPSLTGNIAKLAAAGAGYGGVAGFGEGEGDFSNRASHAGVSALFGGALGGLLPVVGAGIRKALETDAGRKFSENVVAPAARFVADKFEGAAPARSLSAAAPDGSPGVTGPFTEVAQSFGNQAQTGAVERIASAVQRSGLTREQIERKLTELGPEGFLADIDPQFLAEARRAHTMPGETRTWAKNALEGRDAGRMDRMKGAFEGTEPPPSTYRLMGEGQAFQENARAVGRSAYQGDMAEAGLRQSPELMALYENPIVKGAIDRVLEMERQTRAGGVNRAPSSPVEIMHKVKEAIEGMAYGPNGVRAGPEAQWLRELAGDFVAKFKAANPAAAEADAAYTQAKSLPEHFQRGYDFLNTGRSERSMNASSEALADMLLGADNQQMLATRSGMTNAVRDEVSGRGGPAKSLSLARDVSTSPEIQARIAQAYPEGQAANIVRQAGAERTFAETSNEILRGSKTADKIAEMLDTNAAIRVSPSGATPRVLQHLKDLPDLLVRPNEPVRNEIGRLMLHPDQEEAKRILKLAEELMKKRARGTPARLSAAASAGETYSRE